MATTKKLEDGTVAQGLILLDESGKQAEIFQPYLIQNNAGYYPDKERFFISGRKPVLNDVISTIWGGPTALYVAPTAPMQMRVVSSSASDTANGTGVRKVHIHYLDADYNEQEETVIMNGATPVNTVATNILRVNEFHAIDVGSNVVSVGNIAMTNTAGTVTYAYINAGRNSARQAFYTVPAGHNAFITHWQASSGSTGNHFAQLTLVATAHNGISYPTSFIAKDDAGTQNGGVAIDLIPPVMLPPKTDVQIIGVSDASNANVIALGAFLGWIEPID